MKKLKIVLYALILLLCISPVFSEELNIYKAGKISFDYKNNRVIAQKVEKAVYMNYAIQSDKLIYDKQRNILLLYGNSIITDENKNFIKGDYIEFNLDTKDIIAINSKLKYNDYIISAHKITGNLITGYRLEKGYFTTCTNGTPHYKFTLQKGYYKVNDYIQAKNVAFKVGSVPLFFVPKYKKKLNIAESNFELQPGYSSSDGAKIKIGLISPKIYSDIFKSKLYLDISENRGIASSADFEYKNNGSEIFNYASYINDNIGTEYGKHKRWKIYNKMRLNLIKNFKLATEADLVSDPEYNRDFTEGLSSRYQTQREFSFTLYKRNIDNIFRIDGKGIYNYDENTNKYKKTELVFPQVRYQLFAKKSDFFNKPVYFNIEANIEKTYDDSDSKTYIKSEIFPSVYVNNKFFKIFNYNIKTGFIQTYDKEITTPLKEKQHNGKFVSNVSLNFKEISNIKLYTNYNFKKRFSDKHNGYKGIEENNLKFIADYKLKRFLFRTSVGYDFRWQENVHKPHFKSSALPMYNRIEYDFTKNTRIRYYSKFNIQESKYENAFLDFSTKFYKNLFTAGLRYLNTPNSDNFDLVNEYSFSLFKKYKFFYNYSLGLDSFHLKDIYTGIERQLHCWIVKFYYNKVTSGNKEFWITFNIAAFPTRGMGLYSNIENQTIRFMKK